MSADQKSEQKPEKTQGKQPRAEPDATGDKAAPKFDADVLMERLSATLAAAVDAKLAPLTAAVNAAVARIETAGLMLAETCEQLQRQIKALPDSTRSAEQIHANIAELTHSLRVLLPANLIALRPEDVMLLREHAPRTPLVLAEQFTTPTSKLSKGHRFHAGDHLVGLYYKKMRLTLAPPDNSGASAHEVRRIIEAEARNRVANEQNAAATALAAEAQSLRQQADETAAAAERMKAGVEHVGDDFEDEPAYHGKPATPPA